MNRRPNLTRGAIGAVATSFASASAPGGAAPPPAPDPAPAPAPAPVPAVESKGTGGYASAGPSQRPMVNA